MQPDALLSYARVAVASILLAALGTAAKAQDLPSFMAPIAGRTQSTPAETATNNVLALNTGMFELYGDAAKVFTRNILSKHPADGSFSTGPAWPRSRPRRSRLFINC